MIYQICEVTMTISTWDKAHFWIYLLNHNSLSHHTWPTDIYKQGQKNQPKTAFCDYWTSIKITINMTCVSKEYEIKRKMEQEQWLKLKMPFLLGYNLKLLFRTRGRKGGGGGNWTCPPPSLPLGENLNY